MPELPEVETTCRGIAPHIEGKTIQNVIVRQAQLRWLIPNDFAQTVNGLTIQKVQRRAKYLLLTTRTGAIVIHLGMSGNLRIVNNQQSINRHDHVDFIFDNNTVLRFNDQRRFGAVFWAEQPVLKHPLLRILGVEPLSTDFSGQLLYHLSRHRKVPAKLFIMDSHIVVGVGNIYANEALFMAGISPICRVCDLTLARCEKLAECICIVLNHAIEQGGTTLRDFVNASGKAGYFQQQLQVYGRGGKPCFVCNEILIETRLNNRTTVFCPHCQKA